MDTSGNNWVSLHLFTFNLSVILNKNPRRTQVNSPFILWFEAYLLAHNKMIQNKCMIIRPIIKTYSSKKRICTVPREGWNEWVYRERIFSAFSRSCTCHRAESQHSLDKRENKTAPIIIINVRLASALLRHVVEYSKLKTCHILATASLKRF